jgi:hypothetical protein
VVPGGGGFKTDADTDRLYEDVDGDDQIDFADIVWLSNHLRGLRPPIFFAVPRALSPSAGAPSERSIRRRGRERMAVSMIRDIDERCGGASNRGGGSNPA